MGQSQSYPLGYTAHEAQRLEDQAARLEEFTEDVLRRAGLCPGMQVLDVGSGVGDVALLAARIVGDEGSVLGVEKAESSIGTARRRAAELGVSNVRFEESDLAGFTTDRIFDAIVGRFVLSYIPGRDAVLQRLSRFVKPGGVVVFLEIDMPQIAQVPPSPLFTRARQWVLEAFAATGAELDMGSNLYPTFLRAGLPAPNMVAAQPVVGGPACPGYDELAQALRSLLPLMESRGIAQGADVGVDTLARRLREEAAASDCVLYMSRVVGAWARVG